MAFMVLDMLVLLVFAVAAIACVTWYIIYNQKHYTAKLDWIRSEVAIRNAEFDSQFQAIPGYEELMQTKAGRELIELLSLRDDKPPFYSFDSTLSPSNQDVPLSQRDPTVTSIELETQDQELPPSYKELVSQSQGDYYSPPIDRESVAGRKGTLTCVNCGHVWTPTADSDEVYSACPVCGYPVDIDGTPAMESFITPDELAQQINALIDEARAAHIDSESIVQILRDELQFAAEISHVGRNIYVQIIDLGPSEGQALARPVRERGTILRRRRLEP